MASIYISYFFGLIILLTLCQSSTTYAIPRNPWASPTLSADTLSFIQPSSTGITQLPPTSIVAEPGTTGVSFPASNDRDATIILSYSRLPEYTHEPRNRRKPIIATIRYDHSNFPENTILYLWRCWHPSSLYNKRHDCNGYASSAYGSRRCIR